VFTTDTAGDWYSITLGAGTALTSGTKYSIVLRVSAISGSNYAFWRKAFGDYTGGDGCLSIDSGASWFTTSDLMFEEYGNATSAPVIDSAAATQIQQTTAQLNSYLSSDNADTETQVRFGYGTASKTAAAFDYPSFTPWVNWNAVSYPYAAITGLSSNTTYYFRAQSINTFSTTNATTELSFATLSYHIAQPPTSALEIPSFITLTATGSGTFSTNTTAANYPGHEVIDDLAAANATPAHFPQIIISTFIALILYLGLGHMLRRLAIEPRGSLWIEMIYLTLASAFLTGMGVYDWWMTLFWIMLVPSIIMAAKGY
jgi:hypothetical protein